MALSLRLQRPDEQQPRIRLASAPAQTISIRQSQPAPAQTISRQSIQPAQSVQRNNVNVQRPQVMRMPNVNPQVVRPQQISLPKMNQPRVKEQPLNPIQQLGKLTGRINDATFGRALNTVVGTVKAAPEFIYAGEDGKNLTDNASDMLVGNTTKLINTANEGVVQPLVGLAQGKSAQQVQQRIDQNLYSDRGGLNNNGTFFPTKEAYDKTFKDPGSFARGFTGAGIGVATEVAPLVRGASLLAKPGLSTAQKVVRGGTEGFGYGFVGTGAQQMVDQRPLDVGEMLIGGATSAVLGGGVPAIPAAARAVKNAGIKRPTKLNDNELMAAMKVAQASTGQISPQQITTDEIILYNQATQKVGGKVGTPEGHQAVVNALNAHRDYETKLAVRDQQWLDANKFTKQHLIPGGTLGGTLATGFKDAKKAGLVFDGVDGKPRFEVDDSGAKISRAYGRGEIGAIERLASPDGLRVGDVLEHPELFKNYPEFADINVRRVKLPSGQEGALDWPTRRMVINEDLAPHEVKGKILHELTHAAQNKEGYVTGTSPQRAGGYDNYRKSAAEAEARAVEARMNMPMSERYVSGVNPAPEKPLPAMKQEFDGLLQKIKDRTASNAESDRYSILRDRIAVAEGKKGAPTPERWVADKPIKMPEKVYRGTSEDTGNGFAMYGGGTYTAASRTEAAQYGVVKELGKESLPSNPLQFRSKADFSQWEHEMARKLGVKKNELYSTDKGAETLVNALGHDGVTIGTGKDMIAVKFYPEKISQYKPQPTFYDSLDVPKQDLIIKNGEGKAMSIEPKPDAEAQLEKFYGQGGDQDFLVGLIEKYKGKGKTGESIVPLLTKAEKARYDEIYSGKAMSVEPKQPLKKGNIQPDPLTSLTGQKVQLPQYNPKAQSSAALTRGINESNQALINAAIKEAKSKGDSFNQGMFEDMNVKNLSQSDIEGVNLYLFGETSVPLTYGGKKPVTRFDAPSQPTTPPTPKPTLQDALQTPSIKPAYLESQLSKAEYKELGITDANLKEAEGIANGYISRVDKAGSKAEVEKIANAGYAELGDYPGGMSFQKSLADAEVYRKQHLIDTGVESYGIELTRKQQPKPTLTDALAGKSTKITNQKANTLLERNRVKPQQNLVSKTTQSPKTDANAKNASVSTQASGLEKAATQRTLGKTELLKQDNQVTTRTYPDNTTNEVKKRGFVKSVKGSDEVSSEVRRKVNGKYNVRSTDKLALTADDFSKGNLKVVSDDVNSRLDKELGTINDQDVADSLAVAKRLDSKGMFNESQTIYDKLAEHGTKGGQTIQAFSLLRNRTPQGVKFQMLKNLKKAGVKLTDAENVEVGKLIDNVRNTKVGTEARDRALFATLDYVSRRIPTANPDKLVNFWRAGLLTAPKTTAGNLLGNSTEMATQKIWSDPIAVGTDKFFSMFTGKRTKTYGTGTVSGIAEGAKKGADYLKTGFDVRNAPNAKYDAPRRVNYNNKVLDTYVNGVYRWMGAQDQPFYYAAKAAAAHDLAKADGMNLKLKGEELANYVEQSVANPEWKPQTFKTAKDVTDYAKYAVYQNETMLGSMASGLKQGASKYKGGRAITDFILPFTQVPSSIAMRIIDRTPIGIAKEMISQVRSKSFDQRAMSEAIGNGSFGIPVIAAGFALASNDMITGAFPTDDKERKLWAAQGKQPYSVKVGDRWYSLNYMQPFGTLMAIGKQVSDDKKAGKSDAEAWMNAGGAAAKSIESQSFLKGLNGVLSAINDPERSMGQFVKSTASSIMPNFIRSGATAIDPMQRETKTPLDAFVGAVPGARQTLPTKRDMFGQDMKANDNPINQYVNPLRPSKVKGQDDKTIQELQRLSNTDNGIVTTTFNNKSIAGVELDDKQVRDLNQMVNSRVKERWDIAISSPDYKPMSDEDKSTILKKIKDTVAENTKAEFVSKNKIESTKQYKTTELSDLPTGNSSKADTGWTDEFNAAKSTYEKESKTWSAAKRDEKEKELATLDVKRNFSKDATSLYNRAEKDIYGFLDKLDEKESKKYFDQILSYGDKMVESGLWTTNKLRDKNGNVQYDRNYNKTGGKTASRGSRSTGTRKASTGRKTASKGRAKSAKGKFDYKLFGFSKSPTQKSQELYSLLRKAKMKSSTA